MRILIATVVFCALISAALFSDCQERIRFKDAADRGEVTGLDVSNNRYGDGIRRGIVALSITAYRGKGDILSIATDRCELKSLTDDKGGKLDEEAKQDAFGTAISWYALGINGDGKSAAARVQVFSLPSVGASRLKATGRIALVVGKTEATFKTGVTEIIQDGKVKAGDTTLVMVQVEKSEDKKTTSVTFQIEDFPRRVIGIEFFDESGEKIEKVGSDSSIVSVQPDGKGNMRLTYRLQGDISKADMNITYWQETEDIFVSFNNSIGLKLTR